MLKYLLLTKLKNGSTITYLCDHPDSQPGDVEPCAGTDVPDTPTTGITIMDTDGEWIEMKKRHQVSRRLQLQRNNIMSQHAR